jgi:hypothetical protein
VGVIKGSYLEQILSLLSGNPESVREVVRESVSLGAQSLLAMVPSLSDVLTESLTEKCVEVCTLLLDSTFFVLSCFAAYNAWQSVGPFPLILVCDIYMSLYICFMFLVLVACFNIVIPISLVFFISVGYLFYHYCFFYVLYCVIWKGLQLQ